MVRYERDALVGIRGLGKHSWDYGPAFKRPGSRDETVLERPVCPDPWSCTIKHEQGRLVTAVRKVSIPQYRALNQKFAKDVVSGLIGHDK